MEKEKRSLLAVILNGTKNMMKEIEAELSTLSFWRGVMAECLASFLNLMIICSIHSTVSNDPDLPYSMAQVYTGVVTGLGMITISTIFLPVSEAHINPAISIAAAVTGRISHTRAMAYISAQACGAVAGAGTVIGLDNSSHQLTDTKISDLGLELLLSFLLSMVFLGVIESSERGKTNNPEVTIGLAYAACLSAARVTLNPAAALGLSFMNKNYNNHWIKWVGPIVGGVAAGFCHRIVKSDKDDLGKREVSEEIDKTGRFVNRERLHNAMDDIRCCSQAVIQENYPNTPKYKQETKEGDQILAKHKKTQLFCPRVHASSVELSRSRRKQTSSLPKGVLYQQVSYQHHSEKVLDGNKKPQRSERGVSEIKPKKRVHYSKDSFEEVFTDGEDQNSGTSSGYYSESLKYLQ